jgi:hypothetical protein
MARKGAAVIDLSGKTAVEKAQKATSSDMPRGRAENSRTMWQV